MQIDLIDKERGDGQIDREEINRQIEKQIKIKKNYILKNGKIKRCLPGCVTDKKHEDCEDKNEG